MLVDDHVVFSEALADTLEGEGIAIAARVSSGREALACVSLVDPDVILVDLELRDMPGIDLGARILAQLPDVALLALTGTAHPETAREALGIGFRGYLTKQIPFPKLLTAIRAAAHGEHVPSHGPSRMASRSDEQDSPALLAQQLSPRASGSELA